MTTRKWRLMTLLTLLMLLVVAGPLAGCARSGRDSAADAADEGAPPAPDNAVEVFVVSQNKYAPNRIPNLYVTEIQKRFHMKWDYVSIPLSAGMEKFNLMFASGHYPDMVPNMNHFASVKTWAAAGYLLPIGDYLDKLPNYRKLFGDDEWRQLLDYASINGKLYMLPSRNDAHDPMAWLYRKDAFEQAGIGDFPRTTEELHQALRKLKSTYPSFDGIGVRGGPNATGIKSLLLGFAHAFRLPPDLGGADGWTGFWNDPDEGGKLVFAPATRKQRDMLAYLAGLYKEGLIDAQFANVSEQQWQDKRRNGKDLIDFQWTSQLVELNRDAQAATPGAVWDYSRYHPRAYDKPGLEFRPIPISLFGPIFSSRLAEDQTKLDRLLTYIDWSATEEGRLFHMMGVPNVTYTAQDGIIRYKDDNDRKKVATEYGFDWFLGKSSAALQSDPPARKGEEAWQTYKALPFVVPRSAAMTEEEWGIVTSAMSAVNEVVYRFATKAVMGLEDVGKDEVWDNYVRELDKVGLQKAWSVYRKYWGDAG